MPDCCATLYPTEPSTGIDRGGRWGPLGHRDSGRCASWLVCPVQESLFFSSTRASKGTDQLEGSRSWKGANGSHGAAGGVPEPFEPCAAVGIGFFGTVGQKVVSAAEC